MGRTKFVCPRCRETILAPDSLAGESAPCPRCGEDVGPWPSPLSLATTPDSAKLIPPLAPRIQRTPLITDSQAITSHINQAAIRAGSVLPDAGRRYCGPGMLLFSTVLLFLPFIEVSCHDRVVLTQSGIETIHGGVSTKSLLKEMAMESSRLDRSDMPQLDPKSKKEVDKATVRPCLAIAFVSVASLLIGVLGVLAPLGEVRCKCMLLAIALCLLVVLVQMSVGFPIKNEMVERLAEKKNGRGSPGDEAGEVIAAMMISVNFTVWFWLWLLVIASSLVPLAIELYQLRVGKSPALAYRR